jgi:hypothetical protein
MHCTQCDALLTDKEATRKHKKTGAYLDMCAECVSFLQQSIISEQDLLDVLIDRDIIDYTGTRYED